MQCVDRDKAGIEVGVPTQEGFDGLAGDVLTTREADVRMPGSKVGFEAGREGGVGHALTQLEKMRMAASDTNPKDLWVPPRGKGS